MKKKLMNTSVNTNNYSAKGSRMHANETAGSRVSKAVDNNKLLLEAVKSGKDLLVESLISRGISASTSDQFGGYPLYYASCYNHENILKMLLKKVSNSIDRPTKMLRTPLQIASYQGHANIVKILIENKADVNLVDSLGMSALHWAAENNHAKIVRILLEASADRSRVNKFGKTALCLASAQNNYEVCEVLQDLDKLNNFSYTDESSCRNEKFRSSQTAKEKLQEKETIKLFEKHGIKLLPVDQTTIIANALKRGQTAVLTEAGKLALKKTEPEFLRTISNMSNTAPRAFAQMSPPKKMKVECLTSNNSDERKTSSTQDESETNSRKTKVIKIDAKQLSNLISRKKLIISRPSRTPTVSEDQKKVDEGPTERNVHADVPKQKINPDEISNQLQLQNQTTLIKDMKRQLEMSMRLTNYYKNKCEMKEREAEVWRSLVQLGKQVYEMVSQSCPLHLIDGNKK